MALELGLAGLQRLDPVRIATPEITTLADRIAQSIALAVWGNQGPTIIRFEQSTHPIHVNMRTGTVMSLLNSATGLVFAAFLPPKLTESLIKTELEQYGGHEPVEASIVERNRGGARGGALTRSRASRR